MEILEPKPPGTFWATQGLLWDCFTSTAQMYVRGQIHLPAALLGTSLTKGGVVPTAVLYTVLPWPVAILSCPGQSPYCLALASRHTVLPWPVAIQPTEPPRRVLFDERQASDMRFGNCWGWDSSTYGRQMWHTVVWQVEALRYKPEGRGFDSRWCH